MSVQQAHSALTCTSVLAFFQRAKLCSGTCDVCFQTTFKQICRLARLCLRLCAGAGNDWHKDKQFRDLNAAKDIIEVKARRDGHELLVTNTDVLVGDILLLDTGDKVRGRSS